MDTLKSRGIAVLKFIGLSLLVDLALFVVVSLSCLIGTRCTRLVWSARMFWVGMVPLTIGMAGMISWLGSGPRPWAIDISDEEEDDQEDEDERPEVAVSGAPPHDFEDASDGDSESLSTRARFALRMLSVGAGGFAISVLIDVLTR